MNTMYAADRDIMKRAIWRKTYPNGETIVLANGEDGPLLVRITPVGNDPRSGIDVEIATNEPDAVTLKEIYEYYRRQDVTWEEWSTKIKNETLVKQHQQLVSEVKGVVQCFAKYSDHVPQIASAKKPRITVDEGSGTIEVDGTIFSGIDYHDCLIVKGLVNAKGNWLSRSEMQTNETQLKCLARIDRRIDYIQENHKAIGNLIERQTKGYRILPHMFD